MDAPSGTDTAARHLTRRIVRREVGVGVGLLCHHREVEDAIPLVQLDDAILKLRIGGRAPYLVRNPC